jgi:hypothetical protein
VVIEDAAADLASQRCSVCGRCLDPSVQEEPLADYEVRTPAEKLHQSPEVREYVQALEQQARRELSREPYHRGRFPVDLFAGLFLIGGGVLILVNVFGGGGGLMSSLINGILPAFGLFIIGALCIIFWAK